MLNMCRSHPGGYNAFSDLIQDYVEVLRRVLHLTQARHTQMSYLLRLAGDLADYLVSTTTTPTLTVSSNATPNLIFLLLAQMESMMVNLLNSTIDEEHETKVMSGTDKVRLRSIAERTRTAVIDLLSSRRIIEGHEEQVGKVYEEVLTELDL